jgi:hypothetical protein
MIFELGVTVQVLPHGGGVRVIDAQVLPQAAGV